MQFGVLAEHLSIDENMVPYFGRHSAKMFIRGKPICFGYILSALSTDSGYIVSSSFCHIPMNPINTISSWDSVHPSLWNYWAIVSTHCNTPFISTILSHLIIGCACWKNMISVLRRCFYQWKTDTQVGIQKFYCKKPASFVGGLTVRKYHYRWITKRKCTKRYYRPLNQYLCVLQ